MPTTYTDQFYTLDPAVPPSVGTTLTPASYTIVDSNNDTLIDASSADTVDGVAVTAAWPGDTVVINVPGTGNVTYTGVTFYLADGRRVFTPTDGQVLQTGTFVSSTYVTTEGPLDVDRLGPPCFMPGTLISTPAGPRRVEDLMPGDLIDTVDSGPMPLILAHRRVFSARQVAARPQIRPVRIKKGALGSGLPQRDLYVSPQHRMLLRSRIVERMFDCPEILAPAAHLADFPGIGRVDHPNVVYIHLVFAAHHVIIAEGAETESLFLGPAIQDCFTEAEIAELMAKLDGHKTLPTVPARPLERGPKVKNAVKRHVKNGVDLCAAPPCDETPSVA